MKRRMHRPGITTIFSIAALAATIIVTAGAAPPADPDQFFKINKSLDLFGRVYKEITINYVDEVDPEKFMQAGIDGMLGTLDPYTVYIDQEDGDEVELLTTGKYGGIGVTIGVRDGAVRVITVLDGYSAQRQGVLPGDKLLEVNGVTVASKKPDEVRNLTRGEPGSEVRVLVEREGERAPIEFVLIREEIQVKNVTYTDILENGVGYVHLERFSRKAGEELRQAIKELKLRGDIKGLILDLRGNPGGLLDAAVDVTSKFIPRGSLIVSTKSRRPEAERKYLSSEEPLLPSIPLIVLTDRISASASEIVAGALQDLDRALIVGTRTFGKGLVQTILPLNYGAQLKVTTARYYIPSGRSIQEIDYMHRDRTGVLTAMPDSLKREFRTAGGRVVVEHGGITPDSLVQEVDPGPMIKELARKSLFFKFVNRYLPNHKQEPVEGVTEEALSAFRKFLEEEKFDFQDDGELKVRDLRQIAERSHYSTEVLSDLERLSTAVAAEKKRGFDRYEDRIAHELTMELMSRVKGERGRIEASLKNDVQLQAALGILKDPQTYARKLGG